MHARSAFLVFCFASSICLVFFANKQLSAQTGTFDDLIINGVGNVIDFRPDGVNPSFSIFANQFAFDVDGDELGALRVANDTRTNSVVLTAEGVGIGTSSPESALDVFAGSGTPFEEARVTIENSFGGDVQPRTLLQMTNSGPVRFQMTNSDSDKTWSFVADSNDQFQIRQNGVGTSSFSIRDNGRFRFNFNGESQMVLQPNGNLRINGALTELSDRNAKNRVVDVDSQKILAKVKNLPLSEWSYRDDENQTRHLGPMAQDFHNSFGLGEDETGITALDTSGVALAAIQGLILELQQKEARILELERKLNKMSSNVEERIEALESAFASVIRDRQNQVRP